MHILKKNIGYLSQDMYFINDLSVRDNLYIAKQSNNNLSETQITDVLRDLDCLYLIDRKIITLSSGEKQRIQLARILLSNPKILLLDEPFANIDKKSAIKFVETLKEISKHKLIIFIDHQYHLYENYYDRYLTINEGVIVEDVVLNQIPMSSQSENVSLVNPVEKQMKFSQLFKLWMKSRIKFHLLYMFMCSVLSVLICLALIFVFRINYSTTKDLLSRIVYVQNRDGSPLLVEDYNELSNLNNEIKIVTNHLYSVTAQVNIFGDQFDNYELYSSNLLYVDDVDGRLPENKNEIVCDINLHEIGDQINITYQGVLDTYTIVGKYRSVFSKNELVIYVYDDLINGTLKTKETNILDYINNEQSINFHTNPESIPLQVSVTGQSQSVLNLVGYITDLSDIFVSYQVGSKIHYVDDIFYQVSIQEDENILVLSEKDFIQLYGSYINDFEYLVRAMNRDEIDRFISMIDVSKYRVIDTYEYQQSVSTNINELFSIVLKIVIFAGISISIIMLNKYTVKKHINTFYNSYRYYQICGVKDQKIKFISLMNFLLYNLVSLMLIFVISIISMVRHDLSILSLVNLHEVIIIIFFTFLINNIYFNKLYREVSHD